MNEAHDPGVRPAGRAPSKGSVRPRDDLSKGWVGKTLAGVVCGLAIGLIASGFFMHPGVGDTMIFDKYQIAMWIVPPIWLAILSCCYLFRDALRAWLWLGGVSIVGFALFKGLAA